MKALPRNKRTFLPSELVDDSYSMNQVWNQIFFLLYCVSIWVIRCTFFHVMLELSILVTSRVLPVRVPLHTWSQKSSCTYFMPNELIPVVSRFVIKSSWTSGMKGVGKSCIWNISWSRLCYRKWSQYTSLRPSYCLSHFYQDVSHLVIEKL